MPPRATIAQPPWITHSIAPIGSSRRISSHGSSCSRRARVRPPHEEAEAPGEVAGLTPRELDVLRLVAEGRTNPEIGKALYMSPKTASVHVSRILSKLDVKTRTEAASAAHRLGLLDARRGQIAT